MRGSNQTTNWTAQWTGGDDPGLNPTAWREREVHVVSRERLDVILDSIEAVEALNRKCRAMRIAPATGRARWTIGDTLEGLERVVLMDIATGALGYMDAPTLEGMIGHHRVVVVTTDAPTVSIETVRYSHLAA